MSTQAKQLNDVPTVDIGPSTRILALDSSGAVGKGTLAETVGRCGNIVELPKAEQGDWWRIANIDFCGVGIICIREIWTQSSPRPVVLGVALDAYPGGNSTNDNGIKVLAGESNRISKIRFVVDVPNKANDGWLDICIPHTDKYKSRRTQIASYGLGIRPVELAEAPSVDNAHFVKEFDMTTLQSNRGGVKYYPSLQKGGGLYEYGWNSPHGREAERVAAERDGVQRGRCKPRYMHATWDISDYLSYDMCITATASRSTLAICSRGSSCSRRGSLSKTDMQERMRSSSDCKWNRNKLERYGFGLNLLAYGKEVAA